MRIQRILRSKSYCRHIFSRIMRSGITESVCLCNNLWIKLTSIQRLNKTDCFYTSQKLDWKLKMEQVTHYVNRRIFFTLTGITSHGQHPMRCLHLNKITRSRLVVSSTSTTDLLTYKFTYPYVSGPVCNTLLSNEVFC